MRPFFFNNIKALGPSGIRIVCGIVHFIDAEGHGIFKALCKIVGDRHALLDGFRLRVADIILLFLIGFHHPLIGRMSLSHIDRQKIHMIFVIVINLLDIANLATEGWSSKAAEYQHQGPASSPLSDVKYRVAVQRHKPRIRRVIAYFQISTMHVWKRITHHAVGVLRASCHDAEADENENHQRRNRNQAPFEKLDSPFALLSL